MDWKPTVALITIFVEFLLVIFSFRVKTQKNIKYPIISILILLLSYQISEFFICMRIGDSLLLSKMAFLIILWLPAIGIDLIFRLMSGKVNIIYYFPALILAIFVLLGKDFVTSAVCNVFWAKYKNENMLYLFYSIYYELGQIGMIYLSLYGIIKSDNMKTRYSLGLILGATIIFVLFAFLFVVAVPSALGALPSVMCHFAVFLAISLFVILKRYCC